MTNQSTAITVVAFIVGTTSPFLKNHLDTSNLLPSALYSYNYEQRQEMDTYLLEHEMMNENVENTDVERVIEMPTVKTIIATFSKPTPLEFTSVEDKDGFLA